MVKVDLCFSNSIVQFDILIVLYAIISISNEVYLVANRRCTVEYFSIARRLCISICAHYEYTVRDIIYGNDIKWGDSGAINIL